MPHDISRPRRPTMRWKLGRRLDSAARRCIRCDGPLSDLDTRFCIACIHAIGESKAGYVRGRHHLTYIEEVKMLKRQHRHSDAEALLLELIAASEREAADECYTDWYGGTHVYDLAIVYRKDRRYVDEIQLLEWFMAQPGRRGDYTARLTKARALHQAAQTAPTGSSTPTSSAPNSTTTSSR